MTTNMESHSVDGLSIECENLMISLKRVPFNNFIMTKLLKELADAKINVEVITRTAPVNNAFDVSLIVEDKELAKVRDIVNTLGDEYPEIQLTINRDISRLSIHGLGMRTQSGVAAKFLQVIADHNVRVLMITTSEISISVIVKNEDLQRATDAVRAEFNL